MKSTRVRTSAVPVAILAVALGAAGIGAGPAAAESEGDAQAPVHAGVMCDALVRPVDPAATPETVNLFQQMYYNAGDFLMYGKQDDLALNSVNTAARVAAFNGLHNGDSSVKIATGRYPAVFGWDIGYFELKGDNEQFGSAADEGRPAKYPAGGRGPFFEYDGRNIDDIPWEDYVLWIKEAHAMGGINTISWHAVNPVTYGGYSANLHPDATTSVLPGGVNHDRYQAWLDTIVEFNSELVDENGTPIPIIFRPYHEHSGDWFWWGIDDAEHPFQPTSEEDYIALWQFTVDYLKDHGVHNFIYAISPDRSRLGEPVQLDENGNPIIVNSRMVALPDAEFAAAMETYQEEFWTKWNEGFPGEDYVDLYGLDNYWDNGNGHSYHPYRGQSTKLAELFVSTLDVIAENARADGKLVAMTEGSVSGTEMVSRILGSGSSLFGDRYSDTVYASYALAWRGNTNANNLAPVLNRPDFRWIGTTPDWFESVGCWSVTSTVTADGPTQKTVGQQVPLQVNVTTSGGIPAGTITVSEGEEVLAEVALTVHGKSPDGSVMIKLPGTLSPGTHTLTVVYSGTDDVAPSSVEHELVIVAKG